MKEKTAIIIGAGPAGLTAAYELLERTDVKPIIIEMGSQVGGLAKTVNYKGNRIDIGPHRFFSKSDRVMQWWQKILPIQGIDLNDEANLSISYQNKSRTITLSKDGPNPEKDDKVMLICSRFTRILYKGKFFNYPISLSFQTFINLGLLNTIKIIFSYFFSRLIPIREEKSLEDFMINRFGKKLYEFFFKDYTEKVWGIECSKIKPEWGTQRIKNLSIRKIIAHSIRKKIKSNNHKINQKNIETSLVEYFLYPKYGTGHMWEEVAKQIQQKGGEIMLNHQLIQIEHSNNKIETIQIKNLQNNCHVTLNADYYFSTMPVKELIQSMGDKVSVDIKNIANGLMYRDFISVGLLVNKLIIKNKTKIQTINGLIPDNWIYVQEKNVKLGRIVIYNNFSPFMLANKGLVWLGLDYFCNEADDFWSQSDSDIAKFAINELAVIKIINKNDVLDSTVIREKNSYPAYFGTYTHFEKIKEFTNKIDNLFLIGRNGMHRYNNQDHSMLTAMIAVDNITKNIISKENIWDVNTEQEYIEEVN